MGRSIAVKALGALNLEGACDRCFWLNSQGQLPWNRFPGIFSAFSRQQLAAAKKQLEADVLSQPSLLSNPDCAVNWIKPPVWQRFSIPVGFAGGEEVVYRGSPDWVTLYPDGAWHVEDFKTALHTNDEYLGQYVAQLNGYAHIARLQGHVVRSLGLRYCEPQEIVEQNGTWVTPWSTDYVPVELQPELIPSLLHRALSILDAPCPDYAGGPCVECDRFEHLVSLSRKEKADD